tara:strand:- start:2012 stop:2680 length:669 start_codon:yes stop_codon:yes gene_type:complete
MGEKISITASDGHDFSAYLSIPSGQSKASLVIVQEIFGVNKHIQNLSNSFAKRGYATIAPAFFDRIETNIDLDYSVPSIEKGKELKSKINWDDTITDIRASANFIRDFGPVGLVGYCMGGSIAWIAATRDSGVNASVSYYGGNVIDFVEEKPKIPCLLHFGEKDSTIPLSDVDKITSSHPEVQHFVYENADHGFNCDLRKSYDANSSKLALERTLEFLDKNL